MVSKFTRLDKREVPAIEDWGGKEDSGEDFLCTTLKFFPLKVAFSSDSFHFK